MRTTIGLSQPLSEVQARKLDNFASVFNRAMRKLYVSLIVKKENTNSLKSSYISQFNLNARHYNSIKFSLEGKTKSVIELTKDYIQETTDKLKSEQKYIKSIESKINKFSKPTKNKDNKTDDLLIASQQKIRKNLEFAKKKEARLNDNLSRYKSIVESGNPKLCFGSKTLLKRRTTGYFKSHQEWLDEWRFQRNKEVSFVGSSDENAGNLNAQIRHISGNKFALKLNINPKADNAFDKYIELIFTLNYEFEYIKQVIQNNLSGTIKSALTYRIIKEKNSKTRKNQYLIAVTFDENKRYVKQSQDFWLGCVGVDINQDHLAICETNHSGNYVASHNAYFDASKSTFQNIDSLALAVKSLVLKAKTTGKPIVMEKLDFSKKKNALKAGYNKKRNVQLSSFAYSKIKYLIQARAKDAGIEVLEVNPAYTSVIGKAKYSRRLGISIHKAAAYAIARRGMRIEEKVKVNKAELDLSARKNLVKTASWAEVQKLIQKEKVRPNTRKARIERSAQALQIEY